MTTSGTLATMQACITPLTEFTRAAPAAHILKGETVMNRRCYREEILELLKVVAIAIPATWAALLLFLI